jgi:hypothetical protein
MTFLFYNHFLDLDRPFGCGHELGFREILAGIIVSFFVGLAKGVVDAAVGKPGVFIGFVVTGYPEYTGVHAENTSRIPQKVGVRGPAHPGFDAQQLKIIRGRVKT